MSIVVGRLPTKEGRAALRRAAEEARLRKVPMIVVDTGRHLRDSQDQEGDRLEELLTELRQTLDDHEIPHEVRSTSLGSDAADDLITVAEEEDAQLIVIGLRRRTPVGKLILGSNAQRILLDASCPVLAVKAANTD